jgi:two-component system, NarL family, response regulator DevR
VIALSVAMRVLVLQSDPWRDMGIARALDRAPGITPILERELGDQTWGKSLASVVLVAESAARTDAKRSLMRIRTKFPQARILVLGEQNDPSAITDFIAQGADGYFALTLGEEKLVKAVRVLARGSVWLPERAVTTLVGRIRSDGSPPSITSTDEKLLRMLHEGLTNKEMAQSLGLAEITVKTRLARLYRRFGVRTRVQLLAYVLRHGLLRS